MEINSAKTGNSIGFFLGWTVAVLTLNRFNADPSSLVVVCFSLVAFSAVVDTTFFKDMKTEFREVLVDDGPMLEIFDAKLAEPLVDGKGGARLARTFPRNTSYPRARKRFSFCSQKGAMFNS